MSKRTRKNGRGRKAPDFSRETERQHSPLKQALEYASRGWPVVPMHNAIKNGCTCHKGLDCSNPGKHPATTHGVKDATTRRSRIKKWWSDMPNANVGIAPGKDAGIVVLDIDPRNCGLDTLKARKSVV